MPWTLKIDEESKLPSFQEPEKEGDLPRPIYINSEGKEIALDPVGMYDKIITMGKSEKQLRGDNKRLEGQIELFADIEDIPVWKEEADKALEKVAQFESSLLKDPDSRTEEAAKTIAELLAVIALPNLAKAVEHYCLPEAKFRALLAAAAIRVYMEEKGRFPDTLSDLVPEYLASVPIDPWSQDVLKYVKTKEKILVYSFGPDRTDNNGAGTGYERSKELEGKDLIFSLLLDSG